MSSFTFDATALVPEASALTPADWARRYVQDFGFEMVPTIPGTKRPLHTGWPGIDYPPEHWDANPRHGMGVKLGRSRQPLASFDVDDPERCRIVFDELGIDLDSLTAGPAIEGTIGRTRAMFLAPAGMDTRHQLVWPAREGVKDVTIFEIRAGGFQDCLPPTVHPDGHRYRWLENRSPWDQDFPPLPEALRELWFNWKGWQPRLQALCPWASAPKVFSKKPASRQDHPAQGSNGDVIARFNEAHDAGAIITAHGYRPKGPNRWTSPTSSSGIAGVIRLPDSDRIYSHHASDPLADNLPHDAFDCFKILVHQGDQWAAVKDAARQLGIARTRAKPGPGAGEAFGADLKAKDGQAGQIRPQNCTHGPQLEQDAGQREGQAGSAMPATPAPSWLTQVGELLQEPPPMKWLVKGILPPDSLALVFGDPSTGKSLIAVEWACCIAMGKPWLGKRVTQGPAVILAGEGHHGIRRRLKGWVGAHDCEADLAAAPLFVSRTGTRMIDPVAFQEVITEIDAVREKHGPPALVLIDTFHRNYSGDENSETDIGLYIRALDELRERYGCTVLTVHHSGHADKNRGRGSSAMGGAHDVMFSFVKDINEIRTLSVTKAKDMEPPPPISFALKQVGIEWRDEDGDCLTTVILEPVDVVATPRQRTASASVKLAMDTLIATIDAVGDPLPDVPNGPDPRPPLVVPLTVWRDAFYDRHHGDSAETKKRAFSRARDDLVAGRAVGCWQGLFWPGLRGDTPWADINGQIYTRGLPKNTTTK